MKSLTESKVAEFLTSLRAVLIPMLMLLAALVILAGLLIFSIFPEVWLPLKVTASALFGFALAYPLTLSSVNSYLLDRRILWGYIGFPEAFGLFSVIMALFFFEVFEPDKAISFHFLAPRIFSSLLFGLVEYLYADLFVKKNAERIQGEDLQIKLTEIQGDHDNLNIRFDALKRLHDELKEDHQEIKQDYEMLLLEVTCRHCATRYKTASINKRHESKCTHNPKKKDNEISNRKAG